MTTSNQPTNQHTSNCTATLETARLKKKQLKDHYFDEDNITERQTDKRACTFGEKVKIAFKQSQNKLCQCVNQGV